jgi:hypothetical protein
MSLGGLSLCLVSLCLFFFRQIPAGLVSGQSFDLVVTGLCFNPQKHLNVVVGHLLELIGSPALLLPQ